MGKMVSGIYQSTGLRLINMSERRTAMANGPIRLHFHKRHKRYELQVPYEQRAIAKDAGLRWDSVHQAWYTEDWRQAIKLIRHADTFAKRLLVYMKTTRSKTTGRYKKG